MDEEDGEYPASAISSWSGFVYQGKIALYHCLKLILGGDTDFELQLDSTDDFAIYSKGVLSSAHQVKAKVGKYRSNYIEALKKSATIELDRIKGIPRFFHVSVALLDTSDHVDSNGEIVKFYSYDGNKYCGLGDIESLTKSIIHQICETKSIPLSESLLDINYCVLSEKISSKSIEIHKQIQIAGDSERKAAYTNRINAQSILDDILNTNPYNDTEYYAIELKFMLHTYLEDKLENSLPSMTDGAYNRARRLYEHIRNIEANELKTLCQMMNPSERFTKVRKNDIRHYSGLIHSLNVDPILEKLPHYLDKDKEFYIPTALDLPEIDEHDDCISDILTEMKSNDDLLKLLFEYNNLIASRAKKSFTINTKYTFTADFTESPSKERINSNIVKKLDINILTKEEAEARLNDNETY